MSKTTDFLKNVLFSYEESLRQTGRTTDIVTHAKMTNSIVVCHNYMHAALLKELYGVFTITLDRYLDATYHIGKPTTQTYIFDHFCEYELIKRKLEEAERIMSYGSIR